METKPRIKLTLLPLDNLLELTSKIFLVVMWGLTIYTFLKLPAIVPTHFNALGKADDYGNKMTLLILPVLATVIYFGLMQLNKYPHIFNYVTKITEGNAQKQYTIATRMLRFLKLVIILLFTFILLYTYLTTIGVINGLGFWFIPLMFALMIVPTIISIIKSFKKENNLA